MLCDSHIAGRILIGRRLFQGDLTVRHGLPARAGFFFLYSF